MAVNNHQTRATLESDLWRACDILRRDNNCGRVMEYVEHIAWLLFLRFLDAQEEAWAAESVLQEDQQLLMYYHNASLRQSSQPKQEALL